MGAQGAGGERSAEAEVLGGEERLPLLPPTTSFMASAGEE